MADRINPSQNAWTNDDAGNNFAQHCRNLDALGDLGCETGNKDDDEQIAKYECKVVVASTGGDQTHGVILCGWVGWVGRGVTGLCGEQRSSLLDRREIEHPASATDGVN